VLFLFIGLIWFFNKMVWVLSLIVISLLIVYSITPFVRFLVRHKVPHFPAVVIVYLCFLLSIMLFLYLVLPTVIIELRGLIRFLGSDFNLILSPYLNELGDLVIAYNLAESIEAFFLELPAYLQQALEQAISFTRMIFNSLVDLLIIFFLVFYLLRDLERLKVGVVRYFPAHTRVEVTRIIDIVDTKVGSYLRGNFIRCGIVGLLTGLGLWFMGMPFAFMLGVAAGVLNILVYIGPYLAGIPAVLISLSATTPSPLLIIVFYVFVQALDAFVITPPLLGKAVDLNPFTVIVAILVGGTLLGLLGVVIAIPTAAALKVIIQYYYLKDERV
jgi:predicted PurR-regulated permease PerM